MKKLFNTVLITIIMLLGFVPEANSAVLKSKFIAGQIKKEVVSQIKQKHEAKIEVKVSALPYQTVEIPDGKAEVKVETDLQNLNSPSIVKVNIFVNKTKVKTFGARVEIKVLEEVWVAKNWIKRGQTLKDLVLEERDVSSLLNNVIDRDFESKRYQARRNIRPGDIINRKYIEKVPTIVKNSPVSLIFKTPLISVTIPAVAMHSGKMGDFIKVKNTEYRKTYVGKVIGKNIVLVNI